MGELNQRGTIVAFGVVLIAVVAASFDGVRAALAAALMMVFPLACVLYPAAMGSVRGLSYITRRSDPLGVRILGWCVLFASMMFCLVGAFTGRR